MSSIEFEPDVVTAPAERTSVRLVSLADVHAAIDTDNRPLPSQLLRADRLLCELGGSVAQHVEVDMFSED